MFAYAAGVLLFSRPLVTFSSCIPTTLTTSKPDNKTLLAFVVLLIAFRLFSVAHLKHFKGSFAVGDSIA